MRRLVRLGATLLVACGGTLTVAADGGDGGDSALGEDAGYTRCASPHGAKLCGGPAGCECPLQYCGADAAYGPSSEVRVCGLGGPNGDDWSFLECRACVDGNLCFRTDARWASTTLECGSPEFGVLLDMYGHRDWVRYADNSTYTGEPLPEPASCPAIPGLQLCGGACGSCPTGYVCVGRSPRHPYSLCVNKGGIPNRPSRCTRGQPCLGVQGELRCLTYKVDDAAQHFADELSVCVDTAVCAAAASAYPGGAFCGP